MVARTVRPLPSLSLSGAGMPLASEATMLKLLTFLWILLMTAAVGAAPILERTPVFPAGFNGVARHRIPGMVVTAKGTVLAYCEARRNNSSDWGEIEVHLRRSTDGGRTWDAVQHIAHRAERIEGNPTKKEGGEREQTVNNPVALVDQKTGAVEFLYCVNYERCFAMRSTDDGVTWSAPREITAAFEPLRQRYDWKVIATGPGHGIQLRSGRLVVPIWLAYGRKGAHAPSATATIYSDDHGATWKAGEVAVPNEGDFKNPNETVVAELSDGRVVLVNRNTSQRNRKILVFSADGASGWSAPVFHEELWEPICMAGVTSHPAAPGMLVFSNPHTLPVDAQGNPKPGGGGKRQNLTVKLSRDDGKTWPVSRVLEPGPSAYSDLAVLKDGTILCFFEAGSSIDCARFNLEWLEGK